MYRQDPRYLQLLNLWYRYLECQDVMFETDQLDPLKCEYPLDRKGRTTTGGTWWKKIETLWFKMYALTDGFKGV